MTSRIHNLIQNKRLQGVFIGLLFCWGGAALILKPPLDRYLESRSQEQELGFLIERHQEQLKSPPVPQTNSELSAFLVNKSPSEIVEWVSVTQSEWMTVFRDQNARVLEQRRLDDDMSIEGLTAARFRYQLEGDLQTMLSVLEQISSSKVPIFVDEFSMERQSGGTRADSRLRVRLELRVWLRLSEPAGS